MGQRGHCRSRGLIIFNVKEKKNHQPGTGCFVNHIIVSADKRVEFVSDWVSYTVLRCRWYNIIV